LAEKRPTWQAETYRKARLVVESYLVPKLGHLDMRSLTTKDVKPLLFEMANKTPVLARKAKQYIGSIVSSAIDDGMRTDDQVLRLSGILPKHKGGHLPAITESPEDLAALMRAIEAYDSPVVASALKLALYTAVRPGVIASARWAEMNFALAEWKIPGLETDGRNRMKTGDDFTTSLSTQAISAIEKMLPFTGGKEYVFPPLAKQKTPHLNRDTLSKALREMGFQGKHTTHGCRATLRSIGRERLDIDIDVLETQLAHAQKTEVDAAYVRIKFREKRRSVMQAWADYLDEIKAILD
jgi:integrase